MDDIKDRFDFFVGVGPVSPFSLFDFLVEHLSDRARFGPADFNAALDSVLKKGSSRARTGSTEMPPFLTKEECFAVWRALQHRISRRKLNVNTFRSHVISNFFPSRTYVFVGAILYWLFLPFVTIWAYCQQCKQQPASSPHSTPAPYLTRDHRSGSIRRLLSSSTSTTIPGPIAPHRVNVEPAGAPKSASTVPSLTVTIHPSHLSHPSTSSLPDLTENTGLIARADSDDLPDDAAPPSELSFTTSYYRVRERPVLPGKSKYGSLLSSSDLKVPEALLLEHEAEHEHEDSGEEGAVHFPDRPGQSPPSVRGSPTVPAERRERERRESASTPLLRRSSILKTAKPGGDKEPVWSYTRLSYLHRAQEWGWLPVCLHASLLALVGLEALVTHTHTRSMVEVTPPYITATLFVLLDSTREAFSMEDYRLKAKFIDKFKFRLSRTACIGDFKSALEVFEYVYANRESASASIRHRWADSGAWTLATIHALLPAAFRAITEPQAYLLWLQAPHHFAFWVLSVVCNLVCSASLLLTVFRGLVHWDIYATMLRRLAEVVDPMAYKLQQQPKTLAASSPPKLTATRALRLDLHHPQNVAAWIDVRGIICKYMHSGSSTIQSVGNFSRHVLTLVVMFLLLYISIDIELFSQRFRVGQYEVLAVFDSLVILSSVLAYLHSAATVNSLMTLHVSMLRKEQVHISRALLACRNRDRISIAEAMAAAAVSSANTALPSSSSSTSFGPLHPLRPLSPAQPTLSPLPLSDAGLASAGLGVNPSTGVGLGAPAISVTLVPPQEISAPSRPAAVAAAPAPAPAPALAVADASSSSSSPSSSRGPSPVPSPAKRPGVLQLLSPPKQQQQQVAVSSLRIAPAAHSHGANQAQAQTQRLSSSEQTEERSNILHQLLLQDSSAMLQSAIALILQADHKLQFLGYDISYTTIYSLITTLVGVTMIAIANQFNFNI